MSQNPAPQFQAVGSTRLVVIALVMAVLAVILTNLYIQSIKNQSRADTFTICILNRSLEPGSKLMKTDYREVQIPRTFKDPFDQMGALSPADAESNVNSRTPLVYFASSGEILTARIFTGASSVDTDTSVPRKQRWVSLPVNSRTVPALFGPAQFVDIAAAFNTGGAVPQVMTVMERVRVVAIGTRVLAEETSRSDASRPIGSFQTITIAVSPENAVDMSLIRASVGEFELFLRNPDDTELTISSPKGINPKVLEILDKLKSSSPLAPR